MVKLHDDGKAHDARCGENRCTCACNHVFQAFDNRLYILNARPNPQITPLYLAQEPILIVGQAIIDDPFWLSPARYRECCWKSPYARYVIAGLADRYFLSGIVSGVSLESTTKTANKLAGSLVLAFSLIAWWEPGAS